MSQPLQQVEEILDKLVRDVESSVHAFYRGDVRQNTKQAKTGTYLAAARQALAQLVSNEPAAAGVTVSASASAASPLGADELAAVTRCVMAWLPMGAPSAASPQSRCVSAAREMAPTWGEREKARLAMKRAAG